MSGSNQHRIALVAARKQRGWSQADLGNAVGTDKGYISRLEAGKSNPSLPLARRICAALGCGYEVWDTPAPTCPSCGSVTGTQAKVCFGCGAKLLEETTRGV
jgi:transcriptional regulator with XRE-family HTH domain